MANIYTKSMRDALQEARDYREPEELTEKIKAGKGKVSVLVKSEPPDDFRGDEKSYSKAMKKLYNITIKSNPRTGISQVSGEKSDILKYLQSYDYGIHDPDIEKFWPELLESHIEEVKEHLSYDEWLKEEKGIKEGAHGINSDEHAKYSTEWKNYVTEIVGGRGEMTVTKDGGVMIIKTKDWQTYKAKGWVKREEGENESLELPATGAITSNSTGQEGESEELNEIWPFGKKAKLPKGYNPKPAIKAYDLFRKAYDELKKSGVIDRSGQEELQQKYYHLVVNHLGSREAGRLAIKTINGPDKRFGDGRPFPKDERD